MKGEINEEKSANRMQMLESLYTGDFCLSKFNLHIIWTKIEVEVQNKGQGQRS